MNLTVHDILFLCYLTEYNIDAMYTCMKYDSMSHYIEDYLRFKKERNEPVKDKAVELSQKEAQVSYYKLLYHHINTVTFQEEQYPECLKKIVKSPPILFYKGILPLKRNVGVIGTRKISAFASATVHNVVSQFAENGYGIVSGLAFGIDTLAHQDAVRKKAYTMAVLAHSLEDIYPEDNFRLAYEILEQGGGLISELPPLINRGRMSFIERNRLQAAFSDIIVPVEMGINSGTMHTIRFAKQQHKPIFIIRPMNNQKAMEQYQGIQFLIDKKDEFNVQIMDQDFVLANELKRNGQPSQLNIFE